MFVLLYDRAFPTAALDLARSRAEIETQASTYVESMGHDLTGYRAATLFFQAQDASIYLQRTVGIPRTVALAREEGLPLWYWGTRWFRPFQKEEFRLSLMPDGRVVGLYHALADDAPGADLAEAEARDIATAYLTDDRGWDMADWELVTASNETMPGGRVDHHFEWRQRGWDVGEGELRSELRLAVDVRGDEVAGYGYWLDVPEAFQRQYQEERNRAGLISNLSFYLGLALFGGVAVLAFFLGHRRGVFSPAQGLVAGLAVGGVVLLSELNWLPLAPYWYDTTQSYPAFWIERLISTGMWTCITVATITVLWAGGRYLAGRVWPGEDPLLPGVEDRWVALARGTWRGLMLAGAKAAYVVLFYIVATELLGGWVPLSGPAVNLYATPLPFLSPLAVGVEPAVNEEFLFRLIGIGALLALLARPGRGRAWQRWLALLVPGILWAFAHLGYARDPIYLRGLELTVVALVYGYIFLRFGLVPVIVAHLAWNAGVTAVPLLRAGEAYYVANGALILAGLAAPLLPSVLHLLRKRRTRPAEPEVVAVTDHGASEMLAALAALDVPGARWEAWLDRGDTVLVLRTAGEVAGAAAGRVHSDGTGEIEAFRVTARWQRGPWAGRLAAALEEALRREGATRLAVGIPAGAWDEARFWDERGWTPAITSYTPPAAPGDTRGVWSLRDAIRSLVRRRR